MDLVEVEALVARRERVRDEVVEAPADVGLAAVGEVAAVVEAEAEDGVADFEQGEVDGVVARLGAGHVAAAEPAQGFAEACRVRVPGATVVVAAAEALPFADGDFDCVLAQLVVNFLPDAATGLAEMRRVTRPGGTVAAAVWDYAGAMTLLRRFWDAAVALDPRAAAHDEAGFALATPEALASAWAAAGLTDVVTDAAEVEAHYDGFEDLWPPFEAGAGPAAAYAASLPAAARAELAGRLRRELGVGGEPFTLAARAWLVRGTS